MRNPKNRKFKFSQHVYRIRALWAGFGQSQQKLVVAGFPSKQYDLSSSHEGSELPPCEPVPEEAPIPYTSKVALSLVLQKTNKPDVQGNGFVFLLRQSLT